LAGCLARTAFAQRIVKWLETTVLSNLPGYEFFKGIGESILGAEPTEKREVVLARFNDVLQIGFLVERLENGLLAIFVPGAPNPHSGAVFFMAADQVTFASAAPPAALKCLKRLGAGSNALVGTLKQAVSSGDRSSNEPEFTFHDEVRSHRLKPD
jgi:uncharacterized membrane protein